MQGVAEIVLLPLLGAITIGLFKGIMPKKLPGIWASLLVGISFLVSIGMDLKLASFSSDHRVISGIFFPWITGFGPAIDWRYYLDPLSGIWILVITGVGMLIHIYSIGYMHDDPHKARYFSYLNFFVFSMLLLVLAGNLLILLIGWALVGLASYLLIGFWYHRPSAVRAAKKAFVMNTVGDAGILVGLSLLYIHFHTVSYAGLFRVFDHSHPSAFFEWTAFLLYIGAMAKSAQFPLHMWLVDAMEGPTPVSALIHAATMVTAGVYLMARLYPLLRVAPVLAYIVAAIGALMTILAASSAIFQRDIKKVLAYSTVSQLGYMFLGVGMGAFVAGVFHFMMHAFFKALLFLAAGSVIHALGGEQDMNRMGGLWRKMPWTTWSFLAGTLAISGIYPFSGYFSKEAILGETFNLGHPFLWLVGAVAAGMTTFYMFRLFFLTFFGKPRDEKLHEHAHEAPAVMTVPVVILGILAVVGGFLGTWLNQWLLPAFRAYRGAPNAPIQYGPLWTTGFTLGLAVIAFIIAFVLYIRKSTSTNAATDKGVGRWAFNAWYVDAMWRTLAVVPFKAIGNGVRQAEIGILTGVKGIGTIVWDWAQDLRPLETGYVRRYALSIMVGLGALLAYYLIRV